MAIRSRWTAAADQVNAADVDAVVVPGGYAPDLMRRYPAVLKLVRDAFEQGKVVAAICHAGWVLVSAGILKGKRATSVVGHQRRHDPTPGRPRSTKRWCATAT